MKKKQSLVYGGTANGKEIVSASIGVVGLHSSIEPVPLNRKSKRAYKKELSKALETKIVNRSKSAKNKSNRIKAGRSK